MIVNKIIKRVGKTKKINVKQLVKEVNEFDESFGLKLRHPELLHYPEKYRKILATRSDMTLAAILCVINGINIDDYFKYDETTNSLIPVSPVTTKNPEFKYNSIVDYNSSKNSSVYKIEFKIRFLSFVLSHIIGKINGITNKTNKLFGYNHSSDEMRLVMNKEILETIIRFTKILMTNSHHKNIIIKINELLNFSKKNVNHIKLTNLLNSHILNLRKMCRRDLFGYTPVSDDVKIYNILKVTYMLCTNKTNVQVLPKFKYIENATLKHSMLLLIEELGYILGDLNVSPMFKAFIQSKPEVLSEFHKEAKSSDNVKLGLIALEYTKFVCDDYDISYAIEMMKKKGK